MLASYQRNLSVGPLSSGSFKPTLFQTSLLFLAFYYILITARALTSIKTNTKCILQINSDYNAAGREIASSGCVALPACWMNMIKGLNCFLDGEKSLFCPRNTRKSTSHPPWLVFFLGIFFEGQIPGGNLSSRVLESWFIKEVTRELESL